MRDEIQRISRGSGLVFIAQDFQVLKAKRLKIEQGSDFMGVQHWPGVYRDVTWGQRERGLWRVYAGWERNDLLIQSKTKDMGVLERYQLINGIPTAHANHRQGRWPDHRPTARISAQRLGQAEDRANIWQKRGHESIAIVLHAIKLSPSFER